MIELQEEVMIEFLLKETNTKPLIIHGAGKSKTVPGGVWDTLQSTFYTQVNIFQKYPHLDSIDNCDVTIVTWKGGKYANTKTILETCAEYYDVPLLILDWPRGASFWEGCHSKITSTLNAINTGLIKTKYVMYLDVGDVILLEHPSVILNKCLQLFPGKLMFNAERNHYPKDDVINRRCPRISEKTRSRFNEVVSFDIAKTHTKFKYLNGGVAIGETEKLRKFLEYSASPENHCGIDERPRLTSQVMLRIAQYDNREKVVLDDGCKLSICLYNGALLDQEVHMKDVEIAVK